MTIPYAVTDTRNGVICEELADGGVRITIPDFCRKVLKPVEETPAGNERYL